MDGYSIPNNSQYVLGIVAVVTLFGSGQSPLILLLTPRPLRRIFVPNARSNL